MISMADQNTLFVVLVILVKKLEVKIHRACFAIDCNICPRNPTESAKIVHYIGWVIIKTHSMKIVHDQMLIYILYPCL